VDEIAGMGKSTALESLVRFCDAIETLYIRVYLRRPTHRDLQRLLQKAEARGFPRMIGSIDYMHWHRKIAQLLGKEIMETGNGKKVSSLKPLLDSIHG
ncbi:PREDICTED: putative nuclease HARBI1, partial [Prunus dulcis]